MLCTLCTAAFSHCFHRQTLFLVCGSSYGKAYCGDLWGKDITRTTCLVLLLRSRRLNPGPSAACPSRQQEIDWHRLRKICCRENHAINRHNVALKRLQRLSSLRIPHSHRLIRRNRCQSIFCYREGRASDPVGIAFKRVYERSVGAVFQLPIPDAIYSRDEEKVRKVGRHLMFVCVRAKSMCC
jgi:hypothetical protein